MDSPAILDFPNEVLLQVLQILDNHSLYSAALVHSAFCSNAQSILFRNLHDGALPFINILDESPHLLPYVRSLSLGWSWCADPRSPSLLIRLTSLERLVIDGWHPTDDLVASLRVVLPRLRFLALVILEDFPSDLFYDCREVRTLLLESISVLAPTSEHPVQSSAHGKVHPLNTISISHESGYSILDLLASWKAQVKFRVENLRFPAGLATFLPNRRAPDSARVFGVTTLDLCSSLRHVELGWEPLPTTYPTQRMRTPSRL